MHSYAFVTFQIGIRVAFDPLNGEAIIHPTIFMKHKWKQDR